MVRSADPVTASVAVPCSGLVTPCTLLIDCGGMLLIRLPEIVPTTRTDSVQFEPALTLAPDSTICVAPATAVMVAPPQPFPVKAAVGGLATTNPGWSDVRLSVRPTPVRLIAPALLLRIWMESVE